MSFILVVLSQLHFHIWSLWHSLWRCINILINCIHFVVNIRLYVVYVLYYVSRNLGQITFWPGLLFIMNPICCLYGMFHCELYFLKARSWLPLKIPCLCIKRSLLVAKRRLPWRNPLTFRRWLYYKIKSNFIILIQKTLTMKHVISYFRAYMMSLK